MRHPMLIITDPDGTETERRWAGHGLSALENDGFVDLLHAMSVVHLTFTTDTFGRRRHWTFVEGDGSLCEHDEGTVDLVRCDRPATHVVSWLDPDDDAYRQRALCTPHLPEDVEVLSDDGNRDVEVTRRTVDALAGLLSNERP